MWLPVHGPLTERRPGFAGDNVPVIADLGSSHAPDDHTLTGTALAIPRTLEPRGTPDHPVIMPLPLPALKAPHNLAQGRATDVTTRPWIMDGAAPWVRGGFAGGSRETTCT